ncbi:MFS transporter asaE [Vanrija pseudolonga]|uniref:MFS transporter asaE n=1 Tax=Vanrija pseudolonga TaxID=143232 RepID=A0AAF0Y4E0_9TREE|nr:MFS transporter asaE [Vanrija pseudolonga]
MVPAAPAPSTPKDDDMYALTELTPSSPTSPDAQPQERETSTLPPVDKGKDAILFLLAAAAMDGLVWGFPFSVGVLHEYWSSSLFPGQGDANALSLASTLPTAILFASGAIMGPIFTALPWYERQIQLLGLFVATAGLIASAFVTQAWQLVITFGIMYPFSGAFYLPCATIIFEWFHQYRGLATATVFAGAGVGGTVYPFVVNALLGKFGYRTTMLSLALSYAALNLVAVVFIKRRIPLPPREAGVRRHARRKMDFRWMRARAPAVAFTFMMITSLSSFIPMLWLPSFAATVNATRPGGAAILSILNAVTVPGLMITGHISDRVPVRWILPLWCSVAAAGCLLLWGFGTSSGPLVAFSIVWGMSGASVAGTYGKMVTIMADGDPMVPGLALPLLIALRGVGNLTSGPISTKLLQYGPFKGAAGAYGATTYGPLLIFVSACTFLGGVAGALFPLRGKNSGVGV